MRLRKEGYVPDRDVILALTADEEGGSSNGVDWLLKEHRDWIDAEYCINLDGGEFQMDHGKRLLAGIQASEKVYVDFQFESLNPGGHSSVPTPDNAIYHLAGALARLQSFSFPLHMNDITRNYFARNAALVSGPSAADMKAVAKEPPDPGAAKRLSQSAYFNSLLHTTCVATMLSGGHAPNALSPLLPELTEAMEKTLSEAWPGVPLVATMSTGATDGKYTRIAGIPTYGISCMFFDVNDDRSHGKDERVGVQDFYDGVEFNYRLIRALSARQ